jgi:hypothetical protein
MLQLKVGKVPALVDTGAQFSCVRGNVAEFVADWRALWFFFMFRGLRVS